MAVAHYAEIRPSSRGRWAIYIDGDFMGVREDIGRAFRRAADLAWGTRPTSPRAHLRLVLTTRGADYAALLRALPGEARRD